MTTGIEFETTPTQIAILRVNRPQARNALNWRAQEAFAERIAQVAASAATVAAPRILIITGAGTQAFVAGGDLKELSQHPEAEAGARLHRTMSQALEQLTRLPIPVIAAVNGDAFGGGCEILTACDLRVAADHVHFSFAQIRNALTTGWGGTGRLVAQIGQSRATELLFTGRLVSAHEAQAMGFIHRLTTEDVLATAVAWAEELLTLPRHALAANKALLQMAPALPPAQLEAMEAHLFTALWPQADHLEAMRAFAEKRAPIFNQE